MPIYLQPLYLIAQNRIEALNHGFRAQQSGDGSATLLMLALAGLAVLLAVGCWLFFKMRSERIDNDPQKLFRELSRSYGLGRGQQRLLKRLAETRQETDHAMMFLDSKHWVLDAQCDKRLCRPKTRARLQMMHRLLFSNQPVAAEPTSD